MPNPAISASWILTAMERSTNDDRTKIGDATPDVSFGFTASAAWKGFDLLVFGQGVAGNKVFQSHPPL
jgi:hypothetical protein